MNVDIVQEIMIAVIMVHNSMFVGPMNHQNVRVRKVNQKHLYQNYLKDYFNETIILFYNV